MSFIKGITKAGKGAIKGILKEYGITNEEKQVEIINRIENVITINNNIDVNLKISLINKNKQIKKTKNISNIKYEEYELLNQTMKKFSESNFFKELISENFNHWLKEFNMICKNLTKSSQFYENKIHAFNNFINEKIWSSFLSQYANFVDNDKNKKIVYETIQKTKNKKEIYATNMNWYAYFNLEEKY